MIIERQSILTGIVHTRNLDITNEQIAMIYNGSLIQDVVPHLSDDDREFFLNGITPEEWEEFMGQGDDDDEL